MTWQLEPQAHTTELQPHHKGLLRVGEGTEEEEAGPAPLLHHPAPQLSHSSLLGLLDLNFQIITPESQVFPQVSWGSWLEPTYFLAFESLIFSQALGCFPGTSI